MRHQGLRHPAPLCLSLAPPLDIIRLWGILRSYLPQMKHMYGDSWEGMRDRAMQSILLSTDVLRVERPDSKSQAWKSHLCLWNCLNNHYPSGICPLSCPPHGSISDPQAGVQGKKPSPPFTCKKTEAQRGKETSPVWLAHWWVKPGLSASP